MKNGIANKLYALIPLTKLVDIRFRGAFPLTKRYSTDAKLIDANMGTPKNMNKNISTNNNRIIIALLKSVPL
jgi:hypothetical protein